jgi:serine/threonine-protein phosphatase 2A activator
MRLTKSQRTRPLLSIFDSVLDNKMSRFGNPAFKTFYDKVGEVGRSSEHRSRRHRTTFI